VVEAHPDYPDVHGSCRPHQGPETWFAGTSMSLSKMTWSSGPPYLPLTCAATRFGTYTGKVAAARGRRAAPAGSRRLVSGGIGSSRRRCPAGICSRPADPRAAPAAPKSRRCRPPLGRRSAGGAAGGRLGLVRPGAGLIGGHVRAGGRGEANTGRRAAPALGTRAGTWCRDRRSGRLGWAARWPRADEGRAAVRPAGAARPAGPGRAPEAGCPRRARRTGWPGHCFRPP
jgi:hypothetical protein